MCNFFFDCNYHSSIFTKNAIKNPALAKKWLASWRDVDGKIHHDIVNTAKTSNQGEYGAMLMILRHLRAYVDTPDSYNFCGAPLRWMDDAIIYGDSQIVIHQMTGKYQVKSEELKALWLEAINIVYVLKEDYNIVVKFRWIPRKINNEALGISIKLENPGLEE